MRIVYIHQYFASRKGRTGTRSYEFGRFLAGRGHEVTMITSGVGHAEFPVCAGQLSCAYEIDGIRVVSVAGGYNDPCAGTALPGWRRMLKFYEFSRAATEAGKALPPPDIVFATHTPLTVGLAGMALAHYFNTAFVFEVRDLWPQALVNVGALGNPAAIWWLDRMARRIYRRADHIVALSPGMKDGILRTGVASDKVTVIPNAGDLDLFRPDLDGRSTRAQLSVENKFMALYFGAMGIANGLEYVIEAARILAERGREDILIVLHGRGGRRDALEQLGQQYGLTNVLFSDLATDKEEMARLVAACDACLTIYRATKEHTWSPNKLFDALAAGKPVLINVPGWLRELVDESACGRFVDPQRPEALADALETLSDDPAVCRRMGRNARELAERQFDRRMLAERLEAVLQNALGSTGKAG